MDTDDLSVEAYNAVITEAEKLSHDLTLHYGVLAEDCENEDEYLSKAESLTKEILEYEEYELDDLFFGNPPDRQELTFTLSQILKNIEHVKSIPVRKRKYD